VCVCVCVCVCMLSGWGFVELQFFFFMRCLFMSLSVKCRLRPPPKGETVLGASSNRARSSLTALQCRHVAFILPLPPSDPVS